MATIAQSLLPNHVFGIQSILRDGLHFVDETTVVYTAGHTVVWWSMDQKNQKVAVGSADTEALTAITVSYNRKFVAVAESQMPERPVILEPKKEVSELTKAIDAAKAAPALEIKGPVITLFDSQTAKKKKVLMGGEVGSRSYVSLSFTVDNRSLAAQGGPPEWNLMLWSLDKSKLISSIKVSAEREVFQVRCCLGDPTVITCIGDGFFKTFRATDSLLRQISTDIGKREGQKVLNHLWLAGEGADKASTDKEKEKERVDKERESGCLYAMENGELLYTEGGVIIGAVCPFGGLPGAGIVELMLQFSKGFIAAERGGSIAIYEKVDEENFKRMRSFKVDTTGARMVSFSLSPNEDLIIGVLESRQILVIPFQNSEFYKADEVPKEMTVYGYHSGNITGLDVCVRKPLAVTSSLDKSVRVWNYVDKCCELTKIFPQEALSVALHPSGLHVIVGFTDKLRLMNILMDDMRITKEFNIKSCQDCAFSTGGQYFAAVQSNTVYIFSTYTFENLGNLRAHNGKVRSIWWSPDDTSMLTAGVDGAIYEWQLRDFKRFRENVIKGCVYTSVVGLKDSKTFFAVGSDHKLKELDDTSVVKEYFNAVLLTQISLPVGSRLLFAGTEVGSIRAYRYPLSGDFYEVQAITSPVTRVCVTADSTLLLCAGDDGAVVIFDVRDKEKTLASHVARKDKDVTHWAPEVLVLKVDLEDLKARVQDLEQQLIEVQTHCEYQLKVKDEGIALTVKELTDTFNKDFAESKVAYELLIQQGKEKELELELKQKQIEEIQELRLIEMEEQYSKKMMVEVARYQALETEKEFLRLEYAEDRAVMEDKHEKALVGLTDAYESKLEAHESAYGKLKEQVTQERLEFEETRHQMEEDTDKEIEDLKEKFDSQLASEKETVIRLKGENGIMRKKFLEFQKENEEQREELIQLFQQKKELYDIIGSLERDIAGLKKDIEEGDETIGEKEKRIYDMKRKNLELEKFKFVLDFKIKDLSEQIEPREAELQDAKDQIRKMETELERSHSTSNKKDLAISQLELKLEGMENEQMELRAANVAATTTLKHFQHDYYELAAMITEPEKLKPAVIALYKKYVEDKIDLNPVDGDLEHDNNRQRDFLERSVAGLRRKLQKEMEAHHTNHLHIMQENVSLIKELNELRRELKTMKLTAHKGMLQQGKPGPSHRGSRKTVNPSEGSGANSVGHQLELDDLRHRIVTLEEELNNREERILSLVNEVQDLENVQSRPKSRGELPPMDGRVFQEEILHEDNVMTTDTPPVLPKPSSPGKKTVHIREPYDQLDSYSAQKSGQKSDAIAVTSKADQILENFMSEQLVRSIQGGIETALSSSVAFGGDHNAARKTFTTSTTTSTSYKRIETDIIQEETWAGSSERTPTNSFSDPDSSSLGGDSAVRCDMHNAVDQLLAQVSKLGEVPK
ncbi:unnamed protein product [Calypogeia fissa]